MSFEQVQGALLRWTTAIEAAAALGAELTLAQSGEAAPAEIRNALRGVVAAGGIDSVDDLTPQQQAILAGIVRLYLHQALDLLTEPGRAPGWSYTDPVILDGWGRASAMMPRALAAAMPQVGEVRSFLDVGAGVGLLAVAAAELWPQAEVVSIDTFEPALERARANLAQAGMTGRITLRDQDLADVDDADRYDLAWVPTFFIARPTLRQALPRLRRALRPGGWVALGRFQPPPDPLVAATSLLRTVRGGGSEMSAEEATDLLESAGFAAVGVAVAPGMPMQFVTGQRPA
jgi:SAM-dependent methyltransferase